MRKGSNMPHTYSTKPKPGTTRHTVQQLHKSPDPKFAVFMRSQSGSSAKFKYIMDNLDDAVAAARKFAATAVSHGHDDFTYYVVEVCYRVGIENGKIVDESLK